jgi:hypothetical protein
LHYNYLYLLLSLSFSNFQYRERNKNKNKNEKEKEKEKETTPIFLVPFPFFTWLTRWKKQTPHFDFQSVWVRNKDRTRFVEAFLGTSLLAFFNARTQLLPPNSFLNIYHYYTLEKFPCFFSSTYVLPFTFYNYDYCIANNLQQRWWTFFSPFKITKNKVSWNLVLGLISENKKILCKLYKIYY